MLQSRTEQTATPGEQLVEPKIPSAQSSASVPSSKSPPRAQEESSPSAIPRKVIHQKVDAQTQAVATDHSIPSIAAWLQAEPVQVLQAPGAVSAADSAVLLLVEAPFAALGHPSVSLLKKMLASIDIDLSRCHCAQVAPRGQPQSPQQNEAARQAPPASSLCVANLLEQAQVKLVMYMPLQPTTDNSVDGLGHPLPEVLRLGGAQGVFLHHPEYLLQKPESKREAWEVLKKARSLLESGNGPNSE